MAISAADARAVLERADCLFDDRAVQNALDQMAADISLKFENKNPLVLCVMTGGIIATSELLKRLSFPLELDFIHATRYGDNTTGDKLKWLTKPHKSLQDRDVILIDDILDVGKTLHEIVNYCNDNGAASTSTAVLVEKEHDRKEGLYKADFTGLVVPDRYVFGYGMDYKQFWRNLSAIYAANINDE